MHVWGDNWFKENGNDLGNAINYVTEHWNKYGRIGTNMSKEKYGTFRDNSVFWDGTIYQLIYPGYFRIEPKWRKFYFKIDLKFIRPLNKKLGIVKLFTKYQGFIYNLYLQKVIKKYPNIIDEMVSDLDYYYLIKPGVFGPVDGKAIHSKHWKTLA